jgi:hypothetical protein
MTEKQVVPKVRAWIKSEGCFSDYVETIRYYSSEIDLCWGGICESDTFNLDDVELMLYTGVTDKNGKEIYEGDLITKTGVFNSVVCYGKWKYEEDFGAKSESLGFYIDNSYEDDLWCEPFRYTEVNSNYEVVGNIYENGDKVGYGDE